MEEKKTFYITTPIYYANAKPHLGHAYATVLADTIARYNRIQGAGVFFLTGTADHGEKIIRAAQAKEMGPQAFTDENVGYFKELYSMIDISNDFFIRNSDKENHWPGAQALWEKISKAGDLYKGTYKGLYCVGCEKFITEKDLVEGKCPDHDKEPEWIEEENYFFRLSKYADQVKKLLENDTVQIMPKSRKTELLNFIDEGLEDVSFSRPEGSIPWGIPVPGEKGQMMYVWCEELSNYISALGYGRDDTLLKKFWPADLHVLGKDILRFHAILWPAMLISAGLSVPKRILAHGMIVSEGKKMSKSIGNVIDPVEMVETHGKDAFRYYFTREVSPFEDGDITKEKFIESYNANLANGLGNLVSRTLKMAERYFEGHIERRLSTDMPVKARFETALGGSTEREEFSIPYLVSGRILAAYHAHMEAFEVHRAADAAWELIGILDRYITDYEPFKLIKVDPEKTENIIWNVLYGLHYIAGMIEPMIPATAHAIRETLGAQFGDNSELSAFNTTPLEKPLFARIEYPAKDV